MPTAARTRRTPKKRDAFLAELASSGNVKLACEAASFARSTAYEWREKDEAFRASWDVALETAADALEAEARRRAVEGTSEAVYFQGAEVGHVRRYSDVLLIFLLKSVNRRRFDPDGYVKLAIYDELSERMDKIEEQANRLERRREPRNERR